MALRKFLMLAALALTMASCTGHENAPVPNRPEGFAPWTDAVPPYQIGVGDRLAVKYMATPEMNEDGMVGPDGTVTLRAAGTVEAAGHTLAQLNQIVADQSRRWLIDPKVAVALTDAAGARVYVGGAVARPGPYPLGGRIGVYEAVVIAGGFTPEARVPEIVLIRRNSADKPMLRTVDVKAFLDTGSSVGDVPLAPGDIVFVPRSKVAEVDLWIDQFINRVIPFQRSFSYTINRGTGWVQ